MNIGLVKGLQMAGSAISRNVIPVVGQGLRSVATELGGKERVGKLAAEVLGKPLVAALAGKLGGAGAHGLQSPRAAAVQAVETHGPDFISAVARSVVARLLADSPKRATANAAA